MKTRHFLAFAVLAGYAALLAVPGTLPLRAGKWDIFITLDGAWRVLNGEKPHGDFYSAIGLMGYLPLALGLRIAHGGVNGLAYTAALQAFVLGGWAYLIAVRRCSWWLALAAALLIACVAGAPFAPGDGWWQIGYSMGYNRVGYALTSLVMLECFLPSHGNHRGGFSTGVILGLLLFLKVTYFLAASILIVAALYVGRRTFQPSVRAKAIVLGLAVSVAAFASYFNFHPTPFLHDLALSARVRSVNPSFSLPALLLKNWLQLAALGILAFSFQERIFFLAVAASDVLLLHTNSQRAGCFLTVAAMLILLSRVKPVSLPWIAFATLPFASLAMDTINASLYGIRESANIQKLPGFTRLHSPVLAPLVMEPGTPEERMYRFNDGFDLLRRAAPGPHTLNVLYFSNPFSYGLGYFPAHGGATNLVFGFTFNDRNQPAPKRLAGDAELVMLPRDESWYPGEDYIRSNYKPLAQSDYWFLFQKPE